MSFGLMFLGLGGAEEVEFSGVVIPDPINENVGNGTDVSVVEITVQVFGGTAPYTFQWESATGSIGFLDDTDQITTLLVTGTDTEHIGSINCVVTDALLNVISPVADFDIVQGSPP